jgi:hypothetical protein
MIQRWVWIAAPINGDNMIDSDRNLDLAVVQTILAQRFPLQLLPAVALPSLC